MNCYELAKAWLDETELFHRRDQQDEEYDEPDDEPTNGVCRGCWSPIPMSLGEWCNSCRVMIRKHEVRA